MMRREKMKDLVATGMMDRGGKPREKVTEGMAQWLHKANVA